MWKKITVAVLATVLVLPLQPASALENEDLLAVAAMPLAVAAVSEVTNVPMTQLMDIVTLLNDAAVPPSQFIEVVRYIPVALVVENDEPDFVEFVRLRQAEGLAGTALVTSIEERMQVYNMGGINLDVTRPRIDITDDFVPAVVRTRVAEARNHPHGGPPGQLKKQGPVASRPDDDDRRWVRPSGDRDEERGLLKKPKKQGRGQLDAVATGGKRNKDKGKG